MLPSCTNRIASIRNESRLSSREAQRCETSGGKKGKKSGGKNFADVWDDSSSFLATAKDVVKQEQQSEPASSHEESEQAMAQLRTENTELKRQLAEAQRQNDQAEEQIRLMKEDLFRLNSAYSIKCQEFKKMKDELSAAKGKDVVDVAALQQDLHRLHVAYLTKVQDNERLGVTIDALAADRAEISNKGKSI